MFTDADSAHLLSKSQAAQRVLLRSHGRWRRGQDQGALGSAAHQGAGARAALPRNAQCLLRTAEVVSMRARRQPGATGTNESFETPSKWQPICQCLGSCPP